MCFPGYAGVKGNDQADSVAGKATITSGSCLGRSQVLKSLRHYLRAQSQGHHTINCLEERGIERGSAQHFPSKDKSRPLSIRQTLELFQRQYWGNFWKMGGAHTYFSKCTNTILNETELVQTRHNFLKKLNSCELSRFRWKQQAARTQWFTHSDIELCLQFYAYKCPFKKKSGLGQMFTHMTKFALPLRC